MATVHRLDAITINSTTVKAITESAVTGNVSAIKSMASGDFAPVFIGHGTQAPEIRFTTADLAAVLVTAGVVCEGLALSAASYQYWKLVPQVGRTSRSATSHIRNVVNQGVFYWDTITLPQNDMGTVSVVLASSYDGTNAPIVPAGSVALPAAEVSAATYFGCGPIQINGTLVPNIRDVTISSNITAVPKYVDSVPWPVGIYLQEAAPTITITTEELGLLTSTGLVGGALNGSTGLAIYGRKFINNATGGAQRVAAATEEHLQIVVPSGTYRVDTAQASNSDPGTCQIIVDAAVADSSDALMTFAADAAIPTS
jgi:hypothetical protein